MHCRYRSGPGMLTHISVAILAQDLQGPRPDRPMMLWPWDAWTPLTSVQALLTAVVQFITNHSIFRSLLAYIAQARGFSELKPLSYDEWQTVMALMLILLLFCCVMKFLYHVKYRPNMNAHAPELHKRLRNSDIVHMKTCEASHQDLLDTISALGEFCFSERKQKGRTFREVYDHDANYTKWILAHKHTQHDLSFGYKLFGTYIHLRELDERIRR